MWSRRRREIHWKKIETTKKQEKKWTTIILASIAEVSVAPPTIGKVSRSKMLDKNAQKVSRRHKSLSIFFSYINIFQKHKTITLLDEMSERKERKTCVLRETRQSHKLTVVSIFISLSSISFFLFLSFSCYNE